MLLGFVGVAAWPSIARADCSGTWDLPRAWWLIQDNGYRIEIQIEKQVGNEFYGRAAVARTETYGGSYYEFFSATVNGNAVTLNIKAAGGTYTGSIDENGQIRGTTTNPTNRDTAKWNGDRAATCLAAAEPTATTPPSSEPPKRKIGDVVKEQEMMKQKGALTPGPKIGDILKETTPGPGPAQPPAGSGGAEYATAITPATIYKEPGGAAFKDGNGDDIGIPVGSKFLVLAKKTDPVWYKLQTNPVGWVWGDDVTIGP
jgi:hypothetical protein